ncbi:MAG TPA: SufE family protein [Chthoniobacteraceae bacterium]|nr:SufE family protein [Chthoniobacteraceae bacterium]
MAASSPAERQAALIEWYGIIPDPQERLAAVIARKTKLPEVPEAERTPENLVQGCQSRVWITGRLEEGRCRLAMSAESAMVRGLVAVLCEVYDDATPEAVAAFEPELLEKLGISRNLTPTRLNGMAAVRGWLAALARRLG